MKTYVYKITRTDGKEYIGITPYLSKRMRVHEKSKRFEAQNLISIYADLKSESNEKILSKFEGKNFSEFKKDFTDLLIEYISPISDKIDLLRKNEDHLLKILKNGQEKASNVADKTMKDVKNIIGLSL